MEMIPQQKIPTLNVQVKGHVKIIDDLGNCLLDRYNAVHPQNMARVIARALANEDNHFIHRIAFGNGGTVVDAVQQITHRSPNDGINDGSGWTSRLYNETYSEIIDDRNVNLGTGNGADPSGDPASASDIQDGPGVYSNGDIGILSEVVIQSTLNAGEPLGQFDSDTSLGTENTESDFTFDEIGLFTSGAPDVPTSGYQNVDVGDKNIDDDTGLSTSTSYNFNIVVDGGATQNIIINTPGAGTGPGGVITFGDILPLINGQLTGAEVSITDVDSSIQTFGYLKFTSDATGTSSTILMADPGPSYPADYLFSNITGFPASGGILPAVNGLAAGVQNDPVNSQTERERMVTHLIFSPVLKAKSRSITVTYTLTIQVAQSA